MVSNFHTTFKYTQMLEQLRGKVSQKRKIEKIPWSNNENYVCAPFWNVHVNEKLFWKGVFLPRIMKIWKNPLQLDVLFFPLFFFCKK